MHPLLKHATAGVAAALLFPGLAAATSIPPAQFIAKGFTEALGRGPDAASWQSNINYFAGAGCSPSTLQTFMVNVFSAPEYTNKQYSPQQKTLTLYRAILSREPDQNGFNYWVNQFAQDSTLTAAQVAAKLMSDPQFSAEFTNLANNEICKDDTTPNQSWDYNRGWSHLPAIPTGPVLTQSYVQSCVNGSSYANPCVLPQGAFVLLDSTLTIPPLASLITDGLPAVTEFAKQARLVRNNGNLSFNNLVDVQDGGQLRNVWLSGQRHLWTLGSDQTVRANIHVSGSNVTGNTAVTTIDAVRSDSAFQKSHLESFGDTATVNVSNSLFTGYTSFHFRNQSASVPEPWVDGISHHAKRGTIQNNTIVDPTDAGIVLFGHGPVAQTTVAKNNTIIHAGHSAYVSLVFDTTSSDCVNCSFAGATFDSNLVFGGTMTHVDLMFSVGAAPWGNVCDRSSGLGCGQGGALLNNTTIQGDSRQQLWVQVGLVNDGILSASISGNTPSVRILGPNQPGVDFNCPKGISMYHSPDHATGGDNVGAVHTCIGHQVVPTPYVP